MKRLVHSKRITLTSFLQSFVVFLIIFFNNETFPSINSKFQTIYILFVLAFVILLKMLIIDKIVINNKSLIALFIMFCLVLITIILNNDLTGGYFKILVCLLIGFSFTIYLQLDIFTEKYIRVMLFLSICSLLALYLLKPIILLLPEAIFPRFLNSEELPLINARFSYIVNRDGYYRNFGIFREPGVYQVFLNFALIFELFAVKRSAKIAYVAILTATIITTFSTPGILTALILILVYILQKDKKNIVLYKKGLYLRHTLFPILLGVALIVIITDKQLINNILRSFSKLNIENKSMSIRLSAIVTNIIVWIKKALFGNGISGLYDVRDLMKSSISDINNTSTSGALLSTFGVLFTSIYHVLLFMLIQSFKGNKLTSIIIFGVILFIINSQLLIYNELLYLILFFGISYSPYTVQERELRNSGTKKCKGNVA